jgi:hypothetical protein
MAAESSKISRQAKNKKGRDSIFPLSLPFYAL